ncbi:Hsp20/alpha crystallin family protein [Rhizobium helianthi]|uniref:Hsp20/alpha crystallin family protein n=1 Tax=Rhizobium helianthi TaxID=1132695 RepID=A0ABW4M4G0_9HYPH
MANPSQSPLARRQRDPYAQPLRDLRTLVEEFFNGIESEASGSGLLPNLHSNISETADAIRITTELPGVQQKDISISVDEDSITLKGYKKSEKEEAGDQDRIFHRSERSFGSYERTIRMPFIIDPDRVSASFKDGLLTVIVAKPAETQAKARTIEIVKAD